MQERVSSRDAGFRGEGLLTHHVEAEAGGASSATGSLADSSSTAPDNSRNSSSSSGNSRQAALTTAVAAADATAAEAVCCALQLGSSRWLPAWLQPPLAAALPLRRSCCLAASELNNKGQLLSEVRVMLERQDIFLPLTGLQHVCCSSGCGASVDLLDMVWL